MATSSLQTIVSDIRVFPYSGLTTTVREQSGIARATVTASVTNEEITATTGTVIRSVVLTASLPQNYSYVMTDCFIQLTTDALANVLTRIPEMGFESNWRGEIIGSDATSRFNMICDNIVKSELDVQQFYNGSSAGQITGTTQGTSSEWHAAYLGDYNGQSDSYERIYTTNVVPKSVFRGSSGPVTMNLNIANMVEAPFGGDVFVNARFNFVQYDIDQAYNYIIHTPNLVR
tara:strand:- start:136 stop:828 length:693 start_codon:yes stop_codon:yes gene_type:complete